MQSCSPRTGEQMVAFCCCHLEGLYFDSTQKGKIVVGMRFLPDSLLLCLGGGWCFLIHFWFPLFLGNLKLLVNCIDGCRETTYNLAHSEVTSPNWWHSSHLPKSAWATSNVASQSWMGRATCKPLHCLLQSTLSPIPLRFSISYFNVAFDPSVFLYPKTKLASN